MLALLRLAKPLCWHAVGGRMGYINIIKLCVGAESIEDLIAWRAQNAHIWPKGTNIHVTRMFPKRVDEVLAGGSLYWIIKGEVLLRQRILDLQAVHGSDGISRCAIVMDAELVHTHPALRRPFQGWRYLDPKDSPPDLPKGRAAEAPLPQELARALADMGLR
jgi:hypothetical protein